MNIDVEIRKRLDNHIETARKMEQIFDDIHRGVDEVVKTFRNGGKILLAGNGGSAADAQHWAAEWVVRLTHHLERPGMPAIALTTDTSVLTAGGNDIGFDNIFARQVEALGSSGDLFLAITTSGNSENLIRASITAKEKGMTILAISGSGGGKLEDLCDLSIVIPSDSTQHIQEMQEFTGHILCELSELILYGEK
ncbi:MAG: SIS domain-containing protein [Candidatus Electryonea clarkiae]|nr:SIS domain-containing protein [Candidatus Electryonea clarkiae]MDP8286231.1 SIS domain-containing protein [Candidatus Electryonea clarkiae]